MSSQTPSIVSIPDEGLDVYSLCGMQKGIQFYKNSCYVDATLMLLFYTHGHVDLELEPTSPLYQYLVPIINSIRSAPFYCQEELTTRFRNCIEGHSLLGKIGIGDLMDAEEFIRKIFPRIFKRGFIYYQGNVPNFVHCVINYNTVKKGAGFLSKIFETSMSRQGLHFRSLPHPMLLIKTPFSGLKLQGYDYVIPDLVMRVTSGANKDQSALYELTGVMSYRGSHFVSYMRRRTQRGYKWLYSNSTSHNDISQVINCDSLEKNLLRVMKDPSTFNQAIKSDLTLADLCKTSFIAFYAPTLSQSKESAMSVQPNSISMEQTTPTPNESSSSPELDVSETDKSHDLTESDAKHLKPEEELHTSTSSTSVSSSNTSNHPATTPGRTKHVTKEGAQLLSIATYAFIDPVSPLHRWLGAHKCDDCRNTSSQCLPALFLSYLNDTKTGKYKKAHDILNSPCMVNANINQAMLGDASQIFKSLLHVCKAPAFLKRRSGNIYLMDLPAPAETYVRTILHKLRTEDHVEVQHCFIVSRESLHHGGIIPMEEVYMKSKRFQLYGVICKFEDEYCLYTIQQNPVYSYNQSWLKITCNASSDDIPWKTERVVTDRIYQWQTSTQEANLRAIMYFSQVWIYSPTR